MGEAVARGRIIDRELFRNTDIGDLPIEGRLLYVGMIVHADDDGRMKADARYLTATVFPYDPPLDHNGVLLEMSVREWRDRLADRGLITLYEKDNRKYLSHPKWEKWQPLRKDRYHPSDCPAPTDDGCQVVDRRLSIRPQARTEPNPTEPNRTEVKKPAPASGAKRAPGDPRIQPLIKEFHNRLETKLGEKPKAFNGGAAGRIFSALLKDFPPEQIIERMTSWFNSSDPFIVKNGWRIEMFNMNFNTLKGGSIASITKPGGGYIGAPPVAGKYASLSSRSEHS